MAKSAPKDTSKTKDEEYQLFPDAPKGKPAKAGASSEDTWIEAHEEGELLVDVLVTDKEIILRSAIAGVKPDDLEVFVHNDMLTIRGSRQDAHETMEGEYLVQECHWGSFSRSIILPADVDADNISADLKNGILTVAMPKIERSRKIAVKKR